MTTSTKATTKTSIKKSVKNAEETAQKAADSLKETTPVVESKPTRKYTPKQTQTEIFYQSLENIKSTGDVTLDSIAKRVIEFIYTNAIKTEESEDGFVATYNETEVKLVKTISGTQNRYALLVGELKILGRFASKAFHQAIRQHQVTAATTYDEESLKKAASAFGL